MNILHLLIAIDIAFADMAQVEAAQVEKEAEIIEENEAEAEDDLDTDVPPVDVSDPVDTPIEDEVEDPLPVDEDPVDEDPVDVEDDVDTTPPVAPVVPVADTISPYVSGVRFVSTDGSYGVGADIQLVVEFSERVLTNGSPTLELQLGGGTVLATLVSGSGTSELLFKYTVQDGDTGTSVNYVGTSSLAFFRFRRSHQSLSWSLTLVYPR